MEKALGDLPRWVEPTARRNPWEFDWGWMEKLPM